MKFSEYRKSISIPDALIFSFFSGAGFLDLGFEAAGYDIGFVNEYFHPFLEAYKHARNKMGISNPQFGFHEGSIEELLSDNSLYFETIFNKAKTNKNIVGFIGGPPCPDFSVAGKNKGHEGDNGKLSQTYADLICKHSPDFFLFENVKGLYRTKKHRDFYERLKLQFIKSGYIINEKLINSLDYGVAQDRERIILIGVKDYLHNNYPNFDWELSNKFPKGMALTYSWPALNGDESMTYNTHELPPELTVEYWFKKNNIIDHPNSEHSFKPRAGLQKFITVKEGDVSKKSYKRLHRFRYSPTAAYGNNEVHIHPTLPRRITIAEALAIQSLPIDFELPNTMSLTNMFKTVGNGVPFLAAKGLAESLSDYLTRIQECELRLAI